MKIILQTQQSNKKITRLLLIAALLFAMLIPVYTNAESYASDDDLNSYIEMEFKKTHFPGMTVQIVDAQSIRFTEAYGNCTDLDAGFIIGSLSKSFTAVGIMQLKERGLLQLSDPVSRYLPEVGGNTTVLQLLNHTSGIKEFDTMESFQTSDIAAPFEYANVNYGLLGKMIERVSGVDYGTYIQTRIFEPLGMQYSFTSLERVQSGGLEPGHRNYFGVMAEQAYPYPDSSISGWITVPAGYLIAGTNDMGRYIQMYLRGGDGVLQESSIKEMITNTVDFEEGYQYGLGLGTTQNIAGEPLVLHGGNVENYTTYMIWMPERGIGLIAMFTACDYLVANEMAVTLTTNILNRYIGTETEDIGEHTYLLSHILINAALLLALLLSILPLLLIKGWRVKHTVGIGKPGALFLSLLHLVLPTLLLLILPLLGMPLHAVRGFAPDIFIMLLAGSAILYLTGIIKLIYRIRTGRLVRTKQL